MDVEEEGEDDDVEEEDVRRKTDTTSIEHRAFTVTVRTPQCGHIVCGI